MKIVITILQTLMDATQHALLSTDSLVLEVLQFAHLLVEMVKKQQTKPAMIITPHLMMGAPLRALSNPMDTAPTQQTFQVCAISAEMGWEKLPKDAMTALKETPLDVTLIVLVLWVHFIVMEVLNSLQIHVSFQSAEMGSWQFKRNVMMGIQLMATDALHLV